MTSDIRTLKSFCLIPNDERFDPVTGMALQTAVPVRIRPVTPAER